MRVSLGSFYKEVTGTTTCARATTRAALKRWGIPFDEPTDRRGARAVDIVHIETAKKLWAVEKEALAARRKTFKAAATQPLGRPPNDPIAQNTRALQDLTAAIMLLVEKNISITEVEEKK